MSEIIITAENFEKDVLSSEKPVLIDFFATWCGPCKMMAPVIEKIAEEYDGKLTVGKADVDEVGEIAVRYGIRAVPTLVLFKGGEAVSAVEGFHSKSEIKDWLKENNID